MEENNCPICLDKLDPESSTHMEICKHVFHSGCLWKLPFDSDNNSVLCLICRQSNPIYDYMFVSLNGIARIKSASQKLCIEEADKVLLKAFKKVDYDIETAFIPRHIQ